MKNSIRITVMLAIILSLFTGTVKALEKSSSTVFYSENGSTYETFQTQSYTVGEFLDEHKIVLNEGDQINFERDFKLQNLLMIDVTRAVEVKLFVDDDPMFIKVRTTEATVAEFMKAYGAETEKTYQYDLTFAQAKPENDMKLYVTSFFSRVETKTDVIPFETIFVENTDVDAMTVVNKGANGAHVTKFEVFYINGKEVSRSQIASYVETDQLKQLVYIPTKKAVSSSDLDYLKYSEKMTMSATAYTLAACCVSTPKSSPAYGLTASGMKAGVGVIAVDPKVIPLGTELYVEGYGYCIAGDTGGAVKGNIIDLYFNTLEECIQWGRRPVNLYIIEK